MKNNIIIAGVPRAGKSTVSHLLSKRYGYQHISMDSIIAGFEKCFPETGVNTYQGLSSLETLRVISSKMAPFVRAMLDSGEYDEFEPGMVLDMYQLLPEDYDKYIRGANCEIVYFITSNVSPEERFLIQKKYDTEKDYTFYKSDDELKSTFSVHVPSSLFVSRSLPGMMSSAVFNLNFILFLRLFVKNRHETKIDSVVIPFFTLSLQKKEIKLWIRREYCDSCVRSW